MDLVKLEIDGKRIIADNRQTILQAARANGIDSIPTLCHDEQLEPFASCFVCVVKVKGARSMLPACSTRVASGMVVETNTEEVRQSRKAALELMLSNHYADCAGPCQLECPAGIDIQGYIALAALGRHKDAIQLIKDRNPLPAVCGRVCTRPCEVKGCRRNLLDEPVGIDYIKRYVADLDLDRRDAFKPIVAEPNGHRVAVIGAGPAGLSCSYYLALYGYDVQMFEGLPEAGGMLRYGIPEYRLPKDVLDLEINQILELGVKLSTNVQLGRDFTISGLKEEGYDAVFMGLGAWQSSKMRVQNEDTDGVLPGIDFLKQFALGRGPDIHGTVLVIGGGNTAIDCARTALRLGADSVRLLYRRTRNEMPANEMEIEEADHEGIQMDFLTAPVRVVKHDDRVSTLECIRMELGEPDASGRRSPKPVRGSEFTIDCDFVIAAIGQGTKISELVEGRIPNFLPLGETLNLTRWQTIQVNDETFETSVEGVFSGGDVVTGAATAIEAIAAGRKAAHAIHKYVTEGKAQPEPYEFYSRKDTFRNVTKEDLPSTDESSRRAMPALSVDERVTSFTEVEQGYTPEDLRKEAHRCLECGCSALFDCDLRKQATEYKVDISSFVGEATQYEVDRTHPLIQLDPNKCILCGRCVRICSELVGVNAYGFVSRGFGTMVRPALGGSLLDTDCVSCGLCIGTCPTGAISQKMSLSKPGPWMTVSVPTICHYCGDGCRMNYDTFGDLLFKVSRCEDDEVTGGAHCKRGRFGSGYVQEDARLKQAKIRAGRQLQDTPLDEAINYAGIRLRELCKKYSGSEMALFVSPRMTNEEVFLAQKFARIALKTHNVTTFANLVNEDLFCPDVVSTGSYHDLVDAQAMVVVNSNLDEENFAVSLMCRKAIRKGGRLVYIGPEDNRLSGVAEVFLKCKEGTQSLVMLGILREATKDVASDLAKNRPALWKAMLQFPAETVTKLSGVGVAQLKEAAAVIGKSILKVVIFNKDYRGKRVVRDEQLFAGFAEVLGCTTLALREKANMQGLLDMGANPRWFPGYSRTDNEEVIEQLEKEWCVSLQGLDSSPTDIGELLRQKKIKVAVILGEDPFGAGILPKEMLDGLLAADLLIVGDLFDTDTSRLAHITLPLSAIAETSGTMTSQERRVQRVSKSVLPAAGAENWEILCGIAAQMGYRFKMKYSSVSEVTDEIRRLIPAYAQIDLDAKDGDSIWPLGLFKLERSEIETEGSNESLSPLHTLYLDHLEKRFSSWFDDMVDVAHKARELDRQRKDRPVKEPV